jgi:hypothetical protein
MKECFECGSNDTIENHHVVPRVLGGTKTIPLCVKCHGLVHDRDFVKSRTLQKIGIEKAKLRNPFAGNGRPKNTQETFENFIKKQKVKQICVLRCSTNLSLRGIAEVVGCSLGLVQKVYKKIPDDVAFRLFEEQSVDVPFLCEQELKIKRLEKKILNLKKYENTSQEHKERIVNLPYEKTER